MQFVFVVRDRLFVLTIDRARWQSLEGCTVLLSQLIIFLLFIDNYFFHRLYHVVVQIYDDGVPLHSSFEVLGGTLLRELFNFCPHFVGDVFVAVDALKSLR